MLAQADFDRWIKADSWQVQEGVCLLLGVEPKMQMFLRDNRYQYGGDSAPFWREFDRIADFAKRSLNTGRLEILAFVPNELYRDVSPVTFLRWAQQKKLNIPDELMQLLQDAESEENAADDHAKAPRKSQIVKAACQAVALTLWDDNPDMTIEQMKSHPAILKHAGGQYYSGKNTLRDWLSEVDPRPADKKTGRPRKIPVNNS